MFNGAEFIIPKKENVESIISRFYEYYKGENCFKLVHRIGATYAGVSRERIQDWINHSRKHGELKPTFSNKDKLKPVIAKEPFEILQVDLVDFSSLVSKKDRKQYSYVLSALDVFSRYIFLRPLVSKDSEEVATVLRNIFTVFGYPGRVQTDQGSEFKGRNLFL